MKISFTPVRRSDSLVLSKLGDTLTINGEIYDFAALPEGATLPREAVSCAWLASDVLRNNGEIELTLVLPLGPEASAAARFPAPITPADGAIPLPA